MGRRLSGLLLGLLLTLSILPLTLYAQDDGNGREATIAVITSPIDGETKSGSVTIIGSASHPVQSIAYELQFDNQDDPNEVWLPITQRIGQEVTNDILGVWDTLGNNIVVGTYRIRLLVYLDDPNEPPVVFIVSNIRIINTEPTSLPTPFVAPPTETPVFGITPTPEIFQPPAVAPIIGPQTEVERLSDSSESEPLSINVDQLGNAFCNGVLITFVFFGFIGGYLMLRAQLRPVARQFMSQINQNDDRYE